MNNGFLVWKKIFKTHYVLILIKLESWEGKL